MRTGGTELSARIATRPSVRLVKPEVHDSRPTKLKEKDDTHAHIYTHTFCDARTDVLQRSDGIDMQLLATFSA